jgi:polyisoprenoid-binding protein YceI
MKTLIPLLLLAATPALAAPETYKIDERHTFPAFEISHFGFSTYRGRFDKTSGTITIDREKKTGSAEVSIDVASVSTGVVKLDEHLKSDEFLDAAKYPTITFKGKDFKFSGDKLTSVAGDLTIHGTTKPVTLEIRSFKCGDHPMKKTPMCGADAFTKIKRSEFGVSTYSPNIGEEVTLEIEIEAHAASTKAPTP